MGEVLEKPLHLTEDEIVEMTGYRWPSKQIEALQFMGIPARRRPDNSVFVMRAHCLQPVALTQQQEQHKPKLRPILRKK